jgi:cytochrome oxidase Cu insertion factor (SCO1/SenC/PrrC family)
MADEAEQDEAAREYFTDLEVVDQNGKRMRFFTDVLKDRVVVINVIFTNCQDACPLVTQKLMQTQDRLVPAIKDDVWFVSISTDPERDDSAALKNFAKAQRVDEHNWLFLTGPKQNIDQILKKLRQYNPNINAHSTQLLAGTTRERHEWIPVSPAIPPAGIANILRSLAEERPETKG